MTSVRGVLEAAGGLAFIGAGFTVGLMPGLLATGVVCWLAAAFGGRSDVTKEAADGDPD